MTTPTPADAGQRDRAGSESVANVVFDMDGVLIDSSRAHFASWQRLARELGGEVTEDQFRATFGRQNRDIIPLLFGSGLTAKQISEYSERKERYYRELFAEHVTPLAGAVELVRACHAAGMGCAVGSSGHPENIALALETLGVADCVTVTVSGHDVTRGKPDPAVFLTCARRLGVEAARCVVIEDAPSGVEAALRAGMAAIAVTTEHPRDALSHAHRVVDTLELLGVDDIRALING